MQAILIFYFLVVLVTVACGNDTPDELRSYLIENERERVMQEWPTVLELYRKRDKNYNTEQSGNAWAVPSTGQQHVLVSDKWIQYLHVYGELLSKYREDGVRNTLSRVLDVLIENESIKESSSSNTNVDGLSSSFRENTNLMNTTVGILQSLQNKNWSDALIQNVSSLQHVLPYELTLLEIGIQNGGSLQVWNEYFYHPPYLNVKIVGIDIDKRVSRVSNYLSEKEKDNIFIFIVDATNMERLESYLSTLPFALSGNEKTDADEPIGVVTFDLLIDDGSHRNQDVIAVFENMFLKYIKPGGTWVVEDTHSSYMTIEDGPPDVLPVSQRTPYYNEGLSMLEYFKNLVDVMHIYRIMAEYSEVSASEM